MRKIPSDMMAMMTRWRQEEGHLPPLEPSVTKLSDGVTRFRNQCYADGAVRDRVRHLADLYMPSPSVRRSGAPLVIWVHGGAWRIGSKDDLSGLYGRFGRLLAERGVAFANVNYRLTPRVQHPGHVEDVARAFEWLLGQAGRFGYSANNIFLAGHSAGAHLVALLATDPRWLNRFGLSPSTAVRGVVAISGIYDLRDMKAFLDQELEGTRAGRISDHPLSRAGAAIPVELSHDASPISHVTATTPPFLIVYEQQWAYARVQARVIARTLTAAGDAPEVIEIPGRNHTSILAELVDPFSLTFEAISRFIERHSVHGTD